MGMRRARIELLFMLFVGTASAQERPSLHGDPRLRAWAADYLAERREAVVASVEKDLLSPAPHPFAAHVWCVVQRGLGRLAAPVPDASLRTALGALPRLLALAGAGEHRTMLDEHPPTRAR